MNAKLLQIILFFLLLLNTVVFIASDDDVVESIAGHLGGACLLGLLSCWTGAIAFKKDFSYWKAFFISLVVSPFIGLMAVLGIEAMTCGGTVSLSASILFLAFYSLRDPKVSVHHR